MLWRWTNILKASYIVQEKLNAVPIGTDEIFCVLDGDPKSYNLVISVS